MTVVKPAGMITATTFAISAGLSLLLHWNFAAMLFMLGVVAVLWLRNRVRRAARARMLAAINTPRATATPSNASRSSGPRRTASAQPHAAGRTTNTTRQEHPFEDFAASARFFEHEEELLHARVEPPRRSATHHYQHEQHQPDHDSFRQSAPGPNLFDRREPDLILDPEWNAVHGNIFHHESAHADDRHIGEFP